jgi:predicted transcriptional regulator of viral defense system
MVSELDALSSGQWGLVTAAQAVRVGVSRMRLSRLVASGRLERLLAGVYRDAGAPVDHLLGVRAAWLASDPGRSAEERLGDGVTGVVVGGASAAYLHGIGDLQPEPVQLYSPVRRQTERPEIRYRIRQLEERDVTLVEGLPATTLERTIADLIGDHHDLTLIVDALRDAVRIRGLDLNRLAMLLEPYATRLDQPDGRFLLLWLADLGQIELTPVQTPAQVQQRWAQQVAQLALPNLEPLRSAVLAEALNAAGVQEIVAAMVRSSGIDAVLQDAAHTAMAPTLDALSRTIGQQLRASLGMSSVLQVPSKEMAALMDVAATVADSTRTPTGAGAGS